MTGINSKGYTPKALNTMAGFVVPGFRGNGAGYLSELVDSLKYETDNTHEAPVEVREYVNGKWVYIQTL